METTAKHTPQLHDVVMTPDGKIGKVTGLGGFVGEVRVTFFDGEHADHNPKRLIKRSVLNAAPEMLEALEAAYMELFGGNSTSIEDALNRVPFETTPLDFKMMTALKKAKGL